MLWVLSACVICLGLGGIAGINAFMQWTLEESLYREAEAVPKAYTALILGAKVFSSGRLSHMLEDRVLTGLELYQQGKVQKLLLSGDHGQVEYDEVNAMREYLLDRGVPPQDIFMDHAGFRTYESMYRARDVFQVQDVVIVTQEFHLARSVYTARALGLEAYGLVADRRPYTPASQMKSDLREILARVKAFLDVEILRPTPTYLGEAIPITGDGRKTLD
ncbi:hypothetical protein GF339_11945 [candidate division KSB3 bacterium]|uniref:DUF218 domain-containing protein n=1 Tax=candidate division KSB3 bacterium TaxID=2044937 RepID=A0A9D5Q6V4_9BACT|nr:hypothetical protein [candidate division KSB3 bacterium]MBD3325291.1 hypothetical protein [candidate division KSB3 bacterium]